MHRLGAHHIAINAKGDIAVTVGFDGQAKFWDLVDRMGIAELGEDCPICVIPTYANSSTEMPQDDIFAVALSPKGSDFMSTTHDGRIITRDIRALHTVAATYTTKGSFGLCVDCVSQPPWSLI